MDITAAVVDAPGAPFRLATVGLEAPRADEVRVRIAAVGLCHTDIVGQQGLFGFSRPVVLGHEGAGVVEEVGDAVEGFAPGDRVAISFRSCGVCPRCAEGLPGYCKSFPQLNFIGMRPDGSSPLSLDGAPAAGAFFGQSSFASHAITYARNLVKVPADFPLELAGPLGCGVQTGAGAVLLAMDCEPGASLLVTGGGAVGLSAVMAAAIRGCGPVVVVEPYAARRELALEFGATHVIDPSAQPDLAAAVRAILPEGVDYALDTTGRPDTLAAAWSCLASRGLLGLVGAAGPGATLSIDLNSTVGAGRRLMGIIEGDSDPQVFIPQLIAHHRAGRLPLERLVRTYPLSAINEAVRDHHAGLCVKAVLLLDA